MKILEKRIYEALEKEWNGYSKEDAAIIAAKAVDRLIGYMTSRTRVACQNVYGHYMEEAIVDAMKHCGVTAQEEFIEEWHKKKGLKRRPKPSDDDKKLYRNN